MTLRSSLTDSQGLCAASSLYQCQLSRIKQPIALGNPSHYKNKKDQDEFLTIFSDFLENGSQEIFKKSSDPTSTYHTVANKIVYIVNFLREYRGKKTRKWPPELPSDKWMNMGYNFYICYSL